MQPLHISQADRRTLMAVAQGKQPAETVVRNALVVNVFTGEIVPNQTVAIHSGRIAFVGDNPPDLVAPATGVIDADGQTLAPGFIDTHTHLLSCRYSVPEFVRFAAPGGTTLCVTETIELASIAGLIGIEAGLEMLRDQPMRFLATVPPLMALTAYQERHAPTVEQYRALLARPEVVGLGETYWGNLLRGDARLDALIEATLEAGKMAQGHSAGARGAKLQAYACAGISSCHEPITAEEGLARLRLGLHFMIRDGEIRQDLEAIAPLWEAGVDHRRMVLVTDSVGAERLVERGYLDQNVRRAIGLGLDPVKAIQMVTINPAEHFHLDLHVGSVAPGRLADLVLLPDAATIRPSLVMVGGVIVARDGQLTAAPRRGRISEELLNTVRLDRELTVDDFRITSQGGQPDTARVIEYVTGLVTRESEAAIAWVDGAAQPTGDDILMVAAIDRFEGGTDRFVGWVRGYGLRSGAVATSMSWDSSSIVVIGADRNDMALAANRLRETGGGATVSQGGAIVAELAAPIGGVMSEAPMEAIANDLAAIRRTLNDLGCPFPDPLLSADVLTTGAIPHFRISDRGYVRLRDGSMAGLWMP